MAMSEYEDMLRQRVAGLPPLQKVMIALDAALTGHDPIEIVRQYHHYPSTLEQWIQRDGWQHIWYLSDSGYSRVVWSDESGELFLTSNSRQQVKDNWEAAAPQREAVIKQLKAEYRAMGSDRFAESIVEHEAIIRTNLLLEIWEPSPGQVLWARSFIAALNDGAIWQVPATGQVYKIDKTAQTLTLTVTVEGRQAREWHEMNKILFGKVGYRVLDAPEIFRPGEQAFAEAQCLADGLLNESPELKTLKARRRSLDPEEKREAGDAPVWKASVNGRTWYVVNTHRCYQAKPTVKAAAHAWHNGVEQSG